MTGRSQPAGARVQLAPRATPPTETQIELRGVATNNLRDVDVDIPHRKLTVVTGVSGSGKSSLAFDTLYAEGQRRFLESMSTYARQFLQRMEKPPLTSIENVLPAIALRQRGVSAHGRSTVGTVTELDDHLQMLYAHIGTQFCPECGELVDRDTVGRIVERLEALGEGTRLVFVGHVCPTDEEENQHVLSRLVEEGWRRFWIDGEVLAVEALDVESLLEAADFPVLVDRLVVRDDSKSMHRLVEAIENGMELGGGTLQVIVKGGGPGADSSDRSSASSGRRDAEIFFHRTFRCNGCGAEWVGPQPALFNPNTTIGACPTCTGFGKTMGLDLDKVVPNPYRTIKGNAVVAFSTKGKRRQRRKLLKFCQAEGIPTDVPWRDLSETEREKVIDGHGRYKGVRGYFDYIRKRKKRIRNRIMLARYRGYTRCEDCGGARLSRQARHVLVDETPLHEIYGMRAHDALRHFQDLTLSDEDWAAVDVLYEEIVLRLRYMNDVGLGYLRLDRQTKTLSGGEFQRLHLTSSIGRALTDTLYVLDEPTAGLHARDSNRLLNALNGLRDLGNTVVVVEHDPEIIKGADHCVEIGPRAGEGGGRVVFTGDLDGLRASDTATGRMLSGRVARRSYDRRPVGDDAPSIEIIGATQHNLADLHVHIPLRRLVCVTGVSGSGKSTLVTDVLNNSWCALQGETVDVGRVEEIKGFDAIDGVELMSQHGGGRSSRSNAGTYTKAYDAIRRIMAKTRGAKEAGITTKHFSFNSKGGRCELCEGTGTIVVEMQFMADVELECEACEGKRFSDRVLGVRYRGRNIADILSMTISECLAFFKDSKAVCNRLGPLVDVGLGYLRLGQTTATMSGGELQRLKLASHLRTARSSRSKDTHTLFIFDEPTVGLHMQDVEVLLNALHQLVDEGQSVLVVEHDTDFIAGADWVIDLGPDGGDGGGQIVVEGTPEDVVACEESVTGKYLAEALSLD